MEVNQLAADSLSRYQWATGAKTVKFFKRMADAITERDSVQVKAMIAAFFARQHLALSTSPNSAIVIDDLPLARIKRIMKQDACDPMPRQVSASTVPLMAYAAQVFIGLITQLAWKLSTQGAKRNTLQVKDLKAAVYATSQLDFLIDTIDMFDQQQDNETKLGKPVKCKAANRQVEGVPESSKDIVAMFGSQLADSLCCP